ncbi:hypothetical protein [Hansschlegelia zhihuaiae]|uniref:DUF4148 domain-containing protein n=1 Tax=Hansschlegelia zhihuaiae TaxID=405005 RepID=A0A4Q0MK50_9HYPH|nr:hypothetical protein [Hansschlegelia zhihuaiae]RXF73970.1 hypothetical protein EK403_08365 [Hansschlegelia zhihuaiae]
MKNVLFAAAAAAVIATPALADTVVVRPGSSERTVVEPSTTGTVVEERGAVVEERSPYAPRYELNTQARERTPGVGDGTSSSRNANQN